MAVDLIVTLEELACLEVRDIEWRVEPYIWPALLWIDDNTIATEQLVETATTLVSHSRKPVGDSMGTGDVGRVHPTVGTLRVRFEDEVRLRHAILVVVVLEMDETPQRVIDAGFRAFVSELTEAISSRLLDFSMASGEALDALVAEVQAQVAGAVRSAMSDAFSGWEKVQIATGLLDPDDPVGVAFVKFSGGDVASRPISLTVEDDSPFVVVPTISRYEVRGRLEVRPVVVDRCGSFVVRVNQAQAAVDQVQEVIESLQAQLRGEGGGPGGEPPLPKEYIRAEIERVREEELAPAVAALQRARALLARCRATPSVPGGEVEGVVVEARRAPAAAAGALSLGPDGGFDGVDGFDDVAPSPVALAGNWTCGDCQQLRWPNGTGTGVFRRACSRRVQRWINGKWVWVTETKTESCSPLASSGGVVMG